MATTIENLQVLLSAQTGQFEKRIKGAQKSTSQMTNTVGLLTKSLGALGVVFGAGVLISGLRKMVDEFDRLAKQASRLRVSVDALAGLGFAAERSGGSAEAFGKALEKMNRNIGDVANGVGESKRIFDEWGISAQKLIGMGSEQAFLEIADSISKLDSVQEQAAASAAIFGRSGLELMNTFQLGREGITELTDAHRALTGGFGDAAKDAERLKDALTNLEASWTSIKIAFTPVVEALTRVITLLTNSIVEARFATQKWKAVLIEFDFEKAADINRQWTEFIEAQAVATTSAADAQRDFNDALEEQGDKVENATKLLTRMREEIELFGKAGFEREALRLSLKGNLTDVEAAEFRRLKQILADLEAEREERERVRAGGDAPGILNIPDLPPGLRGGDGAALRPFGPRPAVRPVVEEIAEEIRRGIQTAHVATRAVDLAGPGALSSEAASRQATAIERRRIEEEQLEAMNRIVAEIVALAAVLGEGVEGQQIVELPPG